MPEQTNPHREWCDTILDDDQVAEGLCEACLEAWIDNDCSDDFDRNDDDA